MKIYIIKLSPNVLTNKMSKLEKTLGKPFVKNTHKLMSKKHGMFVIENNNVYQLESTFNPNYQIIKGYNNVDLLVDKTPNTKTKIVSQLPVEYISSTNVELTYKYSKISLIVECFEETNFLSDELKNALKPYNFYFQTTDEDIDLSDLTLQEEFNMFLSCLTNI